MPFCIVSNEQGKDYLADGITDDIITALTRYRWFRVVVRGSVFALRDNLIDAVKTAHQLGARYALHGSVRYSAQQLRISAQLIDAKDGTDLWAERYDLAMADVFAIQDSRASQSVSSISPTVCGASTGSTRPARGSFLRLWAPSTGRTACFAARTATKGSRCSSGFSGTVATPAGRSGSRRFRQTAAGPGRPTGSCIFAGRMRHDVMLTILTERRGVGGFTSIYRGIHGPDESRAPGSAEA